MTVWIIVVAILGLYLVSAIKILPEYERGVIFRLGRLLPQVFYYFLLARVADPVISVPSGNFGNLTAGLIAKRIGLPVRRFVAATNVNDVVPEFLRTGEYHPRPSVRTVANAMDVGAPSNFERMRAMYGDDVGRLRQDVVGASFDDARVIAEIGEVWRRHQYLLDPHGAIAWLGLQQTLADHPDATFLLDSGAARRL